MFDFGIGATELMVIAMIALIVVGPKELPKLLRTIAQFTRKIRSMASEFQRHLEDAAREAGVDDIKKEVNKMTNFTVTKDFEKEAQEINKSVADAAKTKPPSDDTTKPGEADKSAPPEAAIATAAPAKTTAKKAPAKKSAAKKSATKKASASKAPAKKAAKKATAEKA